MSEGSTSHVSFAPSSKKSLCYISSGEDSPTPSPKPSLKRTQDDLNGKLAFNHSISGHYHNLISEAYRNQLKMKPDTVADLLLLREIIKLVDGRICEMEASLTMPRITSSPGKTKKARKSVKEEDRMACTTKKLETEEKSISTPPKRNPSLYRADTPSSNRNSATPFDLLLEREDMVAPDSPRTPRKKPNSVKTPLKITQSTSKSAAKSVVSSSTVMIISDDDDDDAPLSDLFKQLDVFRRRVSTKCALLPEDVLPRQTLKKLSEQPPADYKALQKILVETSNIPDTNDVERKAYADEKLKHYGADLIQICARHAKRQTKQSHVNESTSLSAFRKTVSVHQYTSGEKSIDLERYRYDG